MNRKTSENKDTESELQAKKAEHLDDSRGHRFWIGTIVLTTIGAIISYSDRTNMGIAIVPMSEEFSWNSMQQGVILGAFFAGYVLTQIIGGWLADSKVLGDHGGQIVLSLAVSLCALFTLITPWGAHASKKEGISIKLLVAIRVLFGVAEGLEFPAIHSMICRQVPKRWNNGSIAAITAGCYIGSVMALLLGAPIAASMGWEYIFYIFGTIDCAWLIPWCILWVMKVFWKSESEQSRPPNRENRRIIEIWKVFLSTKNVWVLIVVNFCNVWGFWVFMSWLPTFFRKQFGVELKDLGNFAIIPYIVQGMVSFASGMIGDWLLHRELISLRNLRISSQMVAMWGAAIFMVLAVVAAKDISMGAFYFTLALGFNSLSTVGVSSVHMDLAPTHAGMLFGLVNTAAVLSGLIGVPVSGYILQWTGGKWLSVFGLCALLNIFGSIIWFFFADLKPLLI